MFLLLSNDMCLGARQGLLLTELQVPASEAANAVDVPQTVRVQCVNTHLDSRKWEDKQAQVWVTRRAVLSSWTHRSHAGGADVTRLKKSRSTSAAIARVGTLLWRLAIGM